MTRANRLDLSLPLTLLLAGSSLSSPAVAQQPLDATRAPLDTTDFLGRSSGVTVHDNGEVWGTGPGYKARFDNGGILYVAGLGDTVQQNQTLRLTLRSIARDGTVVSAPGKQPHDPPIAGESDVHYERLGGITERYDIRPDGVQVSWEFPSRPAGNGDLVVRMQLESTLQPGPLRSDGTLPLRLPANESGADLGIDIGGVTGIDAAGNRVAGTSRFSGNTIEFVLPATFVDSASYPLVLDPLLGTRRDLSVTSRAQGRPDVGYEPTHDVYLVVWQEVFSATDTDIRAMRVNAATGAPIGGRIAITTALTREQRPSVGGVNAADAFVILWEDNRLPVFPLALFSQVVDAVNGLRGPGALFSSLGTRPDVAGSPLTDEATTLTVWETVGSIQAASLRVNSSSLTLTLLQSNTSLLSGTAPAITKTGGSNGHYAVVANAGPNVILAIRIDRRLNRLNVVGAVSRPDPVSRLDVAGDGERFLCVWEEREPNSSTLADIRGMSIEFSSNPNQTFFANIVDIQAERPGDESQPAVTMAGELFTVAWRERGFLGSGHDIYFVNVTANLFPEVCGVRSVVRGTNMEFPAMGCRKDGSPNTNADDGIVVWGDTRTNDSVIGSHGFEVWRGGSITQLAGGCGAAGTVGFEGPFAFGNRDFKITLSGASPLTSFAFLNIGFPGAQIAPCGGCNIMLPLITVGATGSGGNYEVSLPVRCEPGLRGLTLDIQFGVVEPSRPCPLIGASWSSLHRLVQDI